MTTLSGSSSGSGGSSAKTNSGKLITLPTPAYMAPRGASLGQSTSTGGSLVSTGTGSAVDTSTGGAIGTFTGIRANSAPQMPPPIVNSSGDKNSTLPTQVRQPTAPGAPTPTTPTTPAPAQPGPPRALASEVRVGPERNPALSSNFLSIIGGAGGLGRRGNMSKRTLIGGA